MSSAFELLQVMGRVSRPQQAVVAEQGIHEGRWTRDQVVAFFELPEREASPKPRRPRVPAVTRRKRLSRRRCSFSRYVRRFSIDVLVHPSLSTGAVTTLVYLISRCGRYKQLQTCTSWLAADLGVSPRTIQNHYRQLEQAGFLVRSSPDRLGRTTIYLTNLVEANPVQKEEAQRVAQHGEGAKICSPTNETDSKERAKSTPKGKALIAKHPGSLRFKGCPKRRVCPSEPLRPWPRIYLPENGIRLALHSKCLSPGELAASVIHLDHHESCRDFCDELPGSATSRDTERS